MSMIPNDKKPYSIAETFRLNAARDAFRTRLAAHWNDSRLLTSSGRPIDCIISPAAPTLAAPHDTTRWWGYTSYFNLLDYPAAIFPVTRLSSSNYNSTTAYPSNHPSRNDFEEFVRGQWNPATYENAPVSLQVVGRRLNEEKVLYALKRIQDAYTLRSN